MKVYSPRNYAKTSYKSKKTFDYGSRYTSRNNAFYFVKRSFFDWVDRNNTFYFQLVGVFILTLALFLSFSGISSASPAAEAGSSDDGVFVYSNFRQAVRNPEANGQIKPAEVYIEPAEDEVVTEVVYEYYKVKSGDTLYSICSKIKVDCDKVKDLNDLQHPYTLSINQEIRYIVEA